MKNVNTVKKTDVKAVMNEIKVIGEPNGRSDLVSAPLIICFIEVVVVIAMLLFALFLP